MSESHF